MDNYIINLDTLFIESVSKEKIKIYDKNGLYEVKKSMLKLLEESCNYYGSSFKGRCVGAKSMLNMNYKLPIIVDEVKEVILIPTSSIKNNNCIWICINNIEDYYKNNNEITIEFINQTKIDFKISYNILENQIFRGTMLLNRLKRRKNVIENR